MKKEEQKIENKNDDESISIFTLFIIIAIVFLPLSLGFTFITNDENFNNMGKLFGYISYGSFGVVGIILMWRMLIKLYTFSKKIKIDKEKIISKIKSIQMNKRKMIYYVIGFLFFGIIILNNFTPLGKNTKEAKLIQNVWCGQYISYGYGMNGMPNKDGALWISRADATKGGSESCGIAFNKESALVVINFPSERIAEQWISYDKELIIIKGYLEKHPYSQTSFQIYNPRFVNFLD